MVRAPTRSSGGRPTWSTGGKTPCSPASPEEGPALLPHVSPPAHEREAGAQPALDPVDHVGGVEPEVAQRARGQRRAVALPADDDDPRSPLGFRDAAGAGGVEPPLQDRPVDDDRPRQL